MLLHLYPHHPWLSLAVVFIAFVYLPIVIQAQQQNVNKSEQHPEPSEKPNIVIILIDDMVSDLTKQSVLGKHTKKKELLKEN